MVLYKKQEIKLSIRSHLNNSKILICQNINKKFTDKYLQKDIKGNIYILLNNII